MMSILIADDHAIVRRGLRALLEARPNWTVCGEAATGREAVVMAKQLNPDIVILDFGMPELNGLEATRQIREALPHTEVLILTMHDSEQLIHKTLEAGAKGYILKNDAADVLVAAVERLCLHQRFFTTKVSEIVFGGALKTSDDDTGGNEAWSRLTPREREILQLIAEGSATKQIADVLGITFKTADTHRTNIMQKLKVHSVSELVRFAIRNRIIEA